MPIKIISFALLFVAVSTSAYLNSLMPLILGFVFWVPLAFIAYLLHRDSIKDEDLEEMDSSHN